MKKRNGSMEYLYVLIILCVFMVSIKSFYSYYDSILSINKVDTKITLVNNDINNISSLISKHIEDNTYSTFNNYDDYDISIVNLTGNIIEPNYVDEVLVLRTIEKDYTNSNMLNLKDRNSFRKQTEYNYFLFSNSIDGINVSYDNSNIEYNLASKTNYYYGIEDGSSEQTELYFSPINNSSNIENKVYYYTFQKNIENINFYVAKITKDTKTVYNIYMEDKKTVKEIYSY